MLPSLKLNSFIFSLGFIVISHAQGHSCSATPDLSWISRLNQHMSNLSISNQQDARAIVNNALRQGLNSKSCTVAQALVVQGEESIRQTIMPNDKQPGLSQTNLKGNDFVYPNLLVFVSFSMPDTSLKTLHVQVTRLGGKLVLRGLINGSFREMAQKLKELQIEGIIDPTLFEAYQVSSVQDQDLHDQIKIKPAKEAANFAPVQRVPMFVLRNAPTHKAEEPVVYDRLMGNVSLEYALEQFASNGETQSLALDLLKTLRSVQ